MFQKKWLLILLSFIIISISATFLFLTVTKESSEVSKPKTEGIEEQEETEKNRVDEEDTLEEKKEESITQNIKDSMTEIVQEAFQFFKKDTHIVAIGDSLSQGVGDETGNHGYVGVLEEELEKGDFAVSFDNFGKRGNRTDHLLKRLEEKPEITKSLKKADIILLTIGANDLMQIMKDNFMHLTEEPFMRNIDPYGERLSKILEHMHAVQPDADIYLLGFFNPFEQYFKEIEELNKIVTLWNNKSLHVSNQYDYASFIPMQDIFKGLEEDVFSEDNFHPNRRGYEIMADRVISFLEYNMEKDEE